VLADGGQDVANRAVYAGVQGLENQEHGIAGRRVEQALERAQVLDVRGEQRFVPLSDL